MKKIVSSILTAVSFFMIIAGCGNRVEENSSIASDSPLMVTQMSSIDILSPSDSDYQYTIQDVCNLQDFLLGRPCEENLDGKTYDLNNDNLWDTFDLCLMRSKISDNEYESDDTLIVYFSRTGNTEKIADYLLEITGADSYVIEAKDPYTDADIKYQDEDCRANKEQNDKSIRPEIMNPISSIDSYDVIFLGYPIWWGEEPRIIDTFLEKYDFGNKTIIPFCTSGSSGIGLSESNISKLVDIGKQLPGKRFSSTATMNEVKEWYDTLELIEKNEEVKLLISVNDTVLTASFADTTAAKELSERLKDDSVTISLNEYGGFEKVGKLPWPLTRTDESIETVPGDIMLYQGNQMTIFYNSNSWSYTKLAHIDNFSSEELKDILGKSDISIKLSLGE